jgi:hypothetical protein
MIRKMYGDYFNVFICLSRKDMKHILTASIQDNSKYLPKEVRYLAVISFSRY